MKYAIIGTGVFGAAVFIYSVFAFLATPEQFKSIAVLFLAITVVFFILVIIRKILEDRDWKRKMEQFKDDPEALKKLMDEKYSRKRK